MTDLKTAMEVEPHSWWVYRDSANDRPISEHVKVQAWCVFPNGSIEDDSGVLWSAERWHATFVPVPLG